MKDDLKIKDPDLSKAIAKYPPMVQNLVTFLVQPACVRILEAGGQYKGSVVINIIDGKAVSMIPGFELKAGFEISD